MQPARHEIFVKAFLRKYQAAIAQTIKRHLVKCRFDEKDVLQYISERILSKLASRANAGATIKRPMTYFRRCIGFYCSEYRRIAGYCVSLPTRPRIPWDHAEDRIINTKFVHLSSLETAHDILDLRESYEGSELIPALLAKLPEQQATALECNIIRNLSIAETAAFMKLQKPVVKALIQEALKSLRELLMSNPEGFAVPGYYINTASYRVPNLSGFDRTDIAKVTIPFSKGYIFADRLCKLESSAGPTSWLPMAFWPDQSVKFAQAQVSMTLQPYELAKHTISPLKTEKPQPQFQFHPALVKTAEALGSSVATLETIDGYLYFAPLLENPEVISQTGHEMVIRSRAMLKPTGPRANMRDFLSVTCWFILYSGLPYFDLKIQLGNDYLTDPLGAVQFNEFSIFAPQLLFMTWYAGENKVDAAAQKQVILLKNAYLGDMQNKKWQFTVIPEFPDKAKWAKSMASHVEWPLYGITEANYWKASGFGSIPQIRVPQSQNNAQVSALLNSWKNQEFGPFGSWGDVKESATTGTPRNCLVTDEFYWAIVNQDPRPIRILAGKAWQQACRNVHMWDLKVEPNDPIFLWWLVRASHNKLGRDVLDQYYRKPETDPLKVHRPPELIRNPDWWFPNGWSPQDTEHWTIDLLYDYWLLTADPWAKEEIRQETEYLNGYLRPHTYSTKNIQAVRAEGWCMKAWAQAFEVLQDPRIKSYALNRLHQIIDPQRWSTHEAKPLMCQHMHPDWTGYPEGVFTYMPWQHGALSGFVKAHEVFEDPLFMTIVNDVIDAVDYAVVTHPTLGKGLRFYVPVLDPEKNPIPANYFDGPNGEGIKFGDSPLGGTHQFLVSLLWWLTTMGSTQLYRNRALTLFNMLWNPNDPGYNKWGYGIGG